MTKWILRICILIVFSVLFLNLLGGAIAEDCQTDGKSAPTSPGNADYENMYPPPEWEGPQELFIGVSSVKSVGIVEGTGTSPFSWEISGGSGFSLGDPSSTTRTNTVITSSDANGTATITATDKFDRHASGSMTVCSKYYKDDDYYFEYCPTCFHKCLYYYHRTIYNASDDSEYSSNWKMCRISQSSEEVCLAMEPISVDYGCSNSSGGYTMCYASYCQDESPNCGTSYWCYGNSGVYE